MILASSAPGIFGGDSFEQIIRVERGARVRLTSQSALQVHPSPLGALRSVRLQPDHSESRSTYDVEDDASLHCHWDPLIPLARARFSQHIDVRLSKTADLYWSDAFMAGRAFADRRSVSVGGAGAGAGERWAFGSLSHELRIARDHTVEFLERYRIVPEERVLVHPWVAGDACYFATAVRSGGGASTVSAVERLQAELVGREGVRGATDAVSPTLWITRIMGNRGVPFHKARQRSKAHMSP